MEQKSYEKEVKEKDKLDQTRVVVVSFSKTEDIIINEEKKEINVYQSPICYTSIGKGYFASDDTDNKVIKKMKNYLNDEFI